jgi:hypothetical protein
MSQKTITINGTIYDALTGMPVAKAPQASVPATSKAPAQGSHTMHHVTQKSQTLNRQIVKKAPVHTVIGKRQPQVRPDIMRSATVKKFATHPMDVKKPVVAKSDLAPAAVHPMVAKAHTKTAPVAQPATSSHAPKPSQVIKQEAIAEAMAKAPSHAEHKKAPRTKKSPRALSIASASLALVLLGGYFTYLNMPSLSVRVAAAQAGINATYPTYRPDGYRLDGPIAYTDGEVSMKFAANAGPQGFSIAQKKMAWDSSAVEQDVNQKTAGSYSTSTVGGLTIYIYGNNASWVNGGILYTLSGNAPLSSDQIDRIASSM